MSDVSPVLEARGLCRSFPSGERRIEVLQGVELKLAAGETISIRGESGSGKSTLLNLLAGLDTPDAGELFWAGEAVNRLGLDARAARRTRSLGMVFQSFYLIPELDARANVLMSARIAGRVGAAERRRVDELLGRVGLAERGHHLPAELSGGERQRVAVARALVNRPKFILADEPTGNLDEKTGEAIVDLLLGVCAEQGTALVLVTHNPAHAKKTSRQLELKLGVLRNA